MPTRKNDRNSNDDKKARKKKADRKDKDLRAAYEWAKANFTAADLQKYTEEDEGIPMEKVIAELEGIHRRRSRRKGA